VVCMTLLGAFSVAAFSQSRTTARMPGHERVPLTAVVLRISWSRSVHPKIVVTNSEKIREVARAVDRYPLNGPGGCSEGFVPPTLTFSFLSSRNGTVVARVSGVTKGVAGAFCEPTVLWVRGAGTQLLVEDSGLLHKINKILGTSLR
jgi:hypothetical protein